ncbi:MAG TPA: hypothetical protein VHX44_14665 [Planctomycetota bacterium]|nr:hypothetical protein [Planctomycetota bacterium]
MRTCPPLVVLACLSIGSVTAEESALRFVDLRVQGGVAVNDGEAASLTIMAGDIGNKDQHVITIDADMGIVIGIRGQVAKVTADFEKIPGDIDVKLGGGTFLGGLGFYLGKNSHAELLAGYSTGIGSSTGSTPFEERDIRYYQYLGELGWYYTWSTHVQVGITAGYSVMKITYKADAGDEKAKADGVDAALSLGYRF